MIGYMFLLRCIQGVVIWAILCGLVNKTNWYPSTKVMIVHGILAGIIWSVKLEWL
jgi:hypothetical protein